MRVYLGNPEDFQSRLVISRLQRFRIVMTLPRALPWAITFCALGAENQEFPPSLYQKKGRRCFSSCLFNSSLIADDVYVFAGRLVRLAG